MFARGRMRERRRKRRGSPPRKRRQGRSAGARLWLDVPSSTPSLVFEKPSAREAARGAWKSANPANARRLVPRTPRPVNSIRLIFGRRTGRPPKRPSNLGAERPVPRAGVVEEVVHVVQNPGTADLARGCVERAGAGQGEYARFAADNRDRTGRARALDRAIEGNQLTRRSAGRKRNADEGRVAARHVPRSGRRTSRACVRAGIDLDLRRVSQEASEDAVSAGTRNRAGDRGRGFGIVVVADQDGVSAR